MNYCVEGIVVLILNTSKKCTHTYFRQKNIVLACDKNWSFDRKKISSQFFCVWGERWKMHFLKSFFVVIRIVVVGSFRLFGQKGQFHFRLQKKILSDLDRNKFPHQNFRGFGDKNRLKKNCNENEIFATKKHSFSTYFCFSLIRIRNIS